MAEHEINGCEDLLSWTQAAQCSQSRSRVCGDRMAGGWGNVAFAFWSWRAELRNDSTDGNRGDWLWRHPLYFLGVRSDSARDETHRERSAGCGAPVLESPKVCRLHYHYRAARGWSACIRSSTEPK